MTELGRTLRRVEAELTRRGLLEARRFGHDLAPWPGDGSRRDARLWRVLVGPDTLRAIERARRLGAALEARDAGGWTVFGSRTGEGSATLYKAAMREEGAGDRCGWWSFEGHWSAPCPRRRRGRCCAPYAYTQPAWLGRDEWLRIRRSNAEGDLSLLVRHTVDNPEFKWPLFTAVRLAKARLADLGFEGVEPLRADYGRSPWAEPDLG